MRRSQLQVVIAVFVLLVAAVNVAATGTSEAETDMTLLEEVQERGYVTVGMMGTYPPYNFINQDEVMDGFDADIARELARRIGVEVEFVPTEWSGMIQGLLSGNFDMVVSQMTITEERRQQMDFTQPYITNEVKLIVGVDETEINQMEDLVGRRVGIGLGTNDEAYLRNEVRPAIGEFEIVTYNDVITSLIDLNTGRIDATINNIYAISPLVEERGFALKTVGDPVKSDNAGIAFRQENTEELRLAIDGALTDMKADGTYDAIFDSWFGRYQ